MQTQMMKISDDSFVDNRSSGEDGLVDKDQLDLVSIIVPCYNEQESLPYFYKEICHVFKNFDNSRSSSLNFEVVFVDDGSQDNTLNMIKEISKRDQRFKYVSFSRNFGKESALYAGLKESVGNYIAVMDVDLQDPPQLILDMYNILKTGEFDIVATRRVDRTNEPPVRSFFARLFYKIMNKISNTDIVDGARDFRLMTRQVVDAILSVCEYNRFSKGIFGWVGFKTKWIEYENQNRVAGNTKWSFWKLFLYSIDGIVAFSTAPLAISSIAGILFCFISFILILFIIIRTLIFGDPVSGWPSTVCVIFFVGGLQLFCVGILGQYLAKTYLETKKRPVYIIKEKSKTNQD